MDHYHRSKRNSFVNDLVDRMAERRDDSKWLDQLMLADDTRFMPIWRSQCLMVRRENDESETIAAELNREEANWLLDRAADVVFLGVCHNQGARFALNMANDDDAVSSQTASLGEFEDLRMASRRLADPQAGLLAYAKALADWQDKHRFCGLCGNPTVTQSAGHVLRCSDDGCRRSHFPRLDPAVIVAVTHSDRLLMGRQAVWPDGQYSVVAGFVEAGESLEQAVAREVREETGVVVDSVTYHSSQPWPFPSSIMLGFDAVARTSEIVPNDKELEHARWFSREDIIDGLNDGSLRLPSAVSISSRLIEDWFDSDKDALRLRDVIAEARSQEWRHARDD